jgi:hypothetical protein
MVNPWTPRGPSPALAPSLPGVTKQTASPQFLIYLAHLYSPTSPPFHHHPRPVDIPAWSFSLESGPQDSGSPTSSGVSPSSQSIISTCPVSSHFPKFRLQNNHINSSAIRAKHKEFRRSPRCASVTCKNSFLKYH